MPHGDGVWVKSELRGLEYGRRLVDLTSLDACSPGPLVVLLDSPRRRRRRRRFSFSCSMLKFRGRDADD